MSFRKESPFLSLVLTSCAHSLVSKHAERKDSLVGVVCVLVCIRIGGAYPGVHTPYVSRLSILVVQHGSFCLGTISSVGQPVSIQSILCLSSSSQYSCPLLYVYLGVLLGTAIELLISSQPTPSPFFRHLSRISSAHRRSSFAMTASSFDIHSSATGRSSSKFSLDTLRS